jgi:hypothetical protein
VFVNLKCPSCGQSQRLSDELLGKKVICASCGTGFRATYPNPDAAMDASPQANRPRPAQTISVRSTRAQESTGPPPVPQQPVRAARAARPDASVRDERGGLPPWVYAVLGAGAAATVLIALAFLAQSLRSRRSIRYPDPAADVAVGVVSAARPGSLPQTVGRPPAPAAKPATPPASSDRGAAAPSTPRS